MMMWGLSVLDLSWHAVDERRDHPKSCYIAECDQSMMVTRLHDQPGGTPCEACADLQLARAEATTASARTGNATCASGKRPYASAQDARAALLDARIAAALHDDTKRREQRCYTCPRCGRWHLTSSPPGAVRRRPGI